MKKNQPNSPEKKPLWMMNREEIEVAILSAQKKTAAKQVDELFAVAEEQRKFHKIAEDAGFSSAPAMAAHIIALYETGPRPRRPRHSRARREEIRSLYDYQGGKVTERASGERITFEELSKKERISIPTLRLILQNLGKK